MWSMGVPLNELIRTGQLFPFDTSKLPWGETGYMPVNYVPLDGTAEAPAKPEEPQSKRSLVELPQPALLEYQAWNITFREIGDFRDVLAQFFETESKLIAEVYSKTVRQADYDWGRWSRQLHGPLSSRMGSLAQRGATDAAVELSVDASFVLEHVRATKWAEAHAAELVGLNVKSGLSITDETRTWIRGLVKTASNEGWSVPKLKKAITSDEHFGKRRAELIARTETQRSYNVGNLKGYEASGVVKGKSWLIVGNDPCEECESNAADGVIDLNKPFSSGDDCPPAHPNCFCRIIPEHD